MDDFKKAKVIIETEFLSEMNKNRNEALKIEVGNALQAIEIEIQKKLTRAADGEDIFSICPLIKQERFKKEE